MHAADAIFTSLVGLTRQQYETMNECNLSFTRPALQFIGLLDEYNVQNTDPSDHHRHRHVHFLHHHRHHIVIFVL